MNSKRMRSFMNLYLSPFALYNGTHLMPVLNSETGRQVWPPNSFLLIVSLSLTSIISKASSGTLIGNSNSSSQTGHQSSLIRLVSKRLSVVSPLYPSSIPTYNFKLPSIIFGLAFPITVLIFLKTIIL